MHVIATDGLRSADERRLARAQQLVASLGGTFHSVVGEDVSAAVVDFARGANATMIVVGVSRHGRLRRLFTGTTGDRIASLAGLDRRPPGHPRRGRAPGADGGRCSRRCPAAARSPGWVGAVAAAGAAHLGAARASPTPTSSRWPMLFLLAATVAGRPGRRAAARAARGAVVGFLLLNWFFTPPVGTLTISEPKNVLALLVFVAVAAGGRDGRGPGLPAGRRRAARPRRGGDHGRAVPVGAHRPGHRRGDRRAAPRDVRPGRRLAARRSGPAGWVVLAASTARPARLDPDEARHPGPGRRRPRARALRSSRCGRATSGCSRRSPCRPGWCWSTAGCASATSGPPPSSGPRRRARRCCARSRTTCARRWPRCAPPSTGCVDRRRSARPTGRELVAAVEASTEQLERLIDNLLDLSRLQTGLLHPVLRDAQPRRGPAARGRRPPAGQRRRSRSTSPRRSCPPTPGCSSGSSPTWSPTRSASPAARRSGCSRTCSPTTVEVMVVDRGPGVPPEAAGADVRAVPAARRHRRRRPRPRAGRRPRARPRRSAARCRPRTPPAAG